MFLLFIKALPDTTHLCSRVIDIASVSPDHVGDLALIPQSIGHIWVLRELHAHVDTFADIPLDCFSRARCLLYKLCATLRPGCEPLDSLSTGSYTSYGLAYDGNFRRERDSHGSSRAYSPSDL